jgi:hypothetical protein
MKILKNIILALSLTLLPLSASTLATASALETRPVTITGSSIGAAKDGLSQTCEGGSCPNGQSEIGNITSGVVSIISYLAGAIAIVMILVSAIRFITSNGDSAKVAAAKTALIYALIGIAVAGASQLLVHYVVSSAAGA